MNEQKNELDTLLSLSKEELNRIFFHFFAVEIKDLLDKLNDNF